MHELSEKTLDMNKPPVNEHRKIAPVYSILLSCREEVSPQTVLVIPEGKLHIVKWYVPFHVPAVRKCSSLKALIWETLLNLEVLIRLVFHGQSILRCYVYLLSITYAELQLLEQCGQEEEHLPPGNGLTNTPPLPQAKYHHFVTLHPVNFCPFSIEETLWVESRWLFPKCSETKKEGRHLRIPLYQSLKQ